MIAKFRMWLNRYPVPEFCRAHHEYLISAVIFSVVSAIFGGYFLLHAQNALFYQKYFMSAVQIYCGYGATFLDVSPWVVVEPNGHAIDLTKVDCGRYEGAQVATNHYFSGWHDTHVLLSYLIAFCWKVFGLSHYSYFAINAFIGGLCGVFFYLLPRVFKVPIWLSLVGLLLVDWHAMLQNSMLVRDFSKTPFLFCVMVLAASILVKSKKFRLVKWLPDGVNESLMVGFVVAVGCGFREDVVVGLPFFALALCFALFLDRDRRAKFLAINLVFLLLSFTSFSSVLDLLNTTQEPSLKGTAHFLILGLAQNFFEFIGFQNVGYFILPHYVDTLAWASIDWGSAGNTVYFGNIIGDYNDVGMTLFKDYHVNLPYDLLMRAVTAVAAVIDHFWKVDQALYWLLFLFLLFSLRKKRPGTFILLTVTYFSAVVALQFASRHVMHLRYIEAALLIIALHEIYHGYQIHKKNFRAGAKAAAISFLSCFVLFSALCAALMITQKYQLEKLGEDYDSQTWQHSTLNDDRFWRPEDGFSEVNGIVKFAVDFSSCDAEQVTIIQDTENIGSRSFVLKRIGNATELISVYGLTYPPHITRTRYKYHTACASEVSFAEINESSSLPLSMFAPSMSINAVSLSKYFSDLKKVLFHNF